MIRRARSGPARSDWTPGSGRLWSPDAEVNRPLDGRYAQAIAGPMVSARYSCWVPVASGAGRRLGDGVYVDVDERTVYSFGETCSLDSAAPDVPYAVGLVLAREAGLGRVEHAVSVSGPFPVGTRLAVARDERTAPVWISLALARYGAIVSLEATALVVEMEQPPGGAGWPPEVGPMYRDAGLIEVEGPLGVWLTPVYRRKRRWFRLRG